MVGRLQTFSRKLLSHQFHPITLSQYCAYVQNVIFEMQCCIQRRELPWQNMFLLHCYSSRHVSSVETNVYQKCNQWMAGMQTITDPTWTITCQLYMRFSIQNLHYDDVRMGAIASQITSLTIVYSIAYSDADQRKHQSSASLALCEEITGDQWIPRTNGQLRGKCFHLKTSSCIRDQRAIRILIDFACSWNWSNLILLSLTGDYLEHQYAYGTYNPWDDCNHTYYDLTHGLYILLSLRCALLIYADGAMSEWLSQICARPPPTAMLTSIWLWLRHR